MPRRSPKQVICHPANHEIDSGTSTVGSPQLAGQPNNQKPVQKRVMANERERERTRSLNRALEILRNRLPVPEAEKRSKIQTLRMAKEYIEFLARFKQEQLNSATGCGGVSGKTQGFITPGANLHSGQSSEGQYDNREEVKEDKIAHNQVERHFTHHSQQPDTPLTYKFYKFRLKAREPLKKSRAHVRSPSEHASDNEAFHTNNLAWTSQDIAKQPQLHT